MLRKRRSRRQPKFQTFQNLKEGEAVQHKREADQKVQGKRQRTRTREWRIHWRWASHRLSSTTFSPIILKETNRLNRIAHRAGVLSTWFLMEQLLQTTLRLQTYNFIRAWIQHPRRRARCSHTVDLTTVPRTPQEVVSAHIRATIESQIQEMQLPKWVRKRLLTSPQPVGWVDSMWIPCCRRLELTLLELEELRRREASLESSIDQLLEESQLKHSRTQIIKH